MRELVILMKCMNIRAKDSHIEGSTHPPVIEAMDLVGMLVHIFLYLVQAI